MAGPAGLRAVEQEPGCQVHWSQLQGTSSHTAAPAAASLQLHWVTRSVYPPIVSQQSTARPGHALQPSTMQIFYIIYRGWRH